MERDGVQAIPFHAPRSCPLYFDLLARSLKVSYWTIVTRVPSISLAVEITRELA